MTPPTSHLTTAAGPQAQITYFYLRSHGLDMSSRTYCDARHMSENQKACDVNTFRFVTPHPTQ